MSDLSQENGPNGMGMESFSRSGVHVPTRAESLESSPSHFFLDPSLVSPMSAPEIADGAHSPYKTNLGLLVDAMETSDKPGSSRSQQQSGSAQNTPAQPRPNPTAGAANGSQGDIRMRSLLAASLAVSPPNAYPVTSGAQTIPQGQGVPNMSIDKVSSLPLIPPN